jgi:AraC-type DNA-binding domain-containing proteins
MDKDYYKERIRLAICYIENNLENKITLRDIADAAMISEYYFHRLFKKETGHTPKDYTKQRQMQEAYKTLSTNRQVEIQDIWIQLGYTSSSHFAKDFRGYFGYNPSELKRHHNPPKKR